MDNTHYNWVENRIDVVKKNIHFYGLNGIRFIAALLVIFSHIEGFKKKASIENVNFLFNHLGAQGVNIFFVLSGFLITYLLISEKETTGSIDISKFYIRRILRIWPLYFLILILGFVVFPNVAYPNYFPNPLEDNYLGNIVLSIFFLPNLVLFLNESYFSTGILWSIGVEEQFYLFWPWMRKKIENLNIVLSVLIAITALKLCLFSIYFFGVKSEFIRVLLKMLSHDLIVVGALFALLFHKKIGLKFLFHPKVSLGFFMLPLFFVALKWYIGTEDYGMMNVLFGVAYGGAILNVSLNPDFFLNLEGKWINYLGKISFGLYMYHSIFIAVGIYLFSSWLKEGFWLGHLLLYAFAMVGSIILASLSYHYFELPFIKIKRKFMVVKSSN